MRRRPAARPAAPRAVADERVAGPPVPFATRRATASATRSRCASSRAPVGHARRPGRRARGLHRARGPHPRGRGQRDPAPDARPELGAPARRRRAPAPAQAHAARLPRRAACGATARSCARRPSARSRRGPWASRSRCASTRRRSRSRSSCAPSSASRTARRWPRLRAPLDGMVDWLTRPRRMLAFAALGPDTRGSCAGCCRRRTARVDAELHALIAERRAAPDLEERDDVLSLLLLARDEDGARDDATRELRDELSRCSSRATRRRRPRWRGRSSACAPPRGLERLEVGGRRRVRRAVVQRDAAPAPGDRRRRARLTRAARSAAASCPPGDGRAVHPARAPAPRHLPRPRGVPARALPRAPRPARTRGSRSAAASAAASARRSRSRRCRSCCGAIAEQVALEPVGGPSRSAAARSRSCPRAAARCGSWARARPRADRSAERPGTAAGRRIAAGEMCGSDACGARTAVGPSARKERGEGWRRWGIRCECAHGAAADEGGR